MLIEQLLVIEAHPDLQVIAINIFFCFFRVELRQEVVREEVDLLAQGGIILLVHLKVGVVRDLVIPGKLIEEVAELKTSVVESRKLVIKKVQLTGAFIVDEVCVVEVIVCQHNFTLHLINHALNLTQKGGIVDLVQNLGSFHFFGAIKFGLVQHIVELRF